MTVQKPKKTALRVLDFCEVVAFIERKYDLDAHQNVPNPKDIPGRVMYAALHPSVWGWLTDLDSCGVNKVFKLPVGYWGPGSQEEQSAPQGLGHVGRFLDLLRKEFGDDVVVHYTK